MPAERAADGSRGRARLRARQRLVEAAALLVPVAFVADALASPPSADAGPAPAAEAARAEGVAGPRERWTIVLLVADAAASDPMSVAVAAQLVDLPVALELVPVGALPSSLAAQHELARVVARERGAALVLWFELSAADHLYLYLSEQERATTLVRELAVDGASPAGRAASAAVIVRGVVDALVRGGHLGVEFVEVELPAPPVAPAGSPVAEAEDEAPAPAPSPEPTALELALAAAYAPELFSDTAPVMHALAVGVELWIRDLVLVNLRYRATFPVTIDAGDAEFELARFPLEFGVRGAGRRGKWDLGGGFVYVLDILERSGRTKEPGVVVSPDERWVRSAIGPVAQAGWRPHPRVRLWLDVGLDMYFRPLSHLGADGETSLLRQYPFRPRAQFGLAVVLGSRSR